MKCNLLYCFDPSRPTFYRKRTVSQRKRENAGNRWLGPECKPAYLSHLPWIGKQQPGAILPALSPAHRARGARRSGTDGNIPLTWPWYSEEEGLSARLADDLLPLGETGDHHQQQGPKAICKGWEKSASDRLCRAETVRRYFYIWVSFWLMHIFYQCLHFNQRI